MLMQDGIADAVNNIEKLVDGLNLTFCRSNKLGGNERFAINVF